MFLINSRQESFAAARLKTGEAYSEVTPAVLPSSFTRNHPFALGYSPCPPVSVYGTDPVSLILETFLGSLLTRIGPPERKPFRLPWS